MSHTVRWGILGLGNIARKFAMDLYEVPEAELVAVASRSSDKATVFSDTIPQDPLHKFGSYLELFECKEVDIIYVATPHHAHLEYTLAAIEHGKHVLCEKPMGVNRAQVERMVTSAREKGVFLMEGLWSRFNPSIKHIVSLVDSGDLGPIRYIRADFAFNALDRDLESRVWNPELAGGALLDIGIYPIFLAYLILGIPDSIQAEGILHTNGVDQQVAMTFLYPEAQAQLFCSFCVTSDMRAEIAGEKGSVFIHPRWHETDGFHLTMDDGSEYTEPTLGKGYTYEIQAAHHALREGWQEHPLWSWKNSLELVGLMDAIRKQIGLKYPFE